MFGHEKIKDNIFVLSATFFQNCENACPVGLEYCNVNILSKSVEGLVYDKV